jgi:hypothetical protein
MQVTVLKDEMNVFERFADGNFNLTQQDKDDLYVFSLKIAKLAKTDKFNQAIIELKSTFENEFKDGCYGISCTNCNLKVDGRYCYFRDFKSQICDMK